LRLASYLEQMFKAIRKKWPLAHADVLRGCTTALLPILLMSACMPQPSEQGSVAEAINSTLSSVVLDPASDDQPQINLKSDFAKALNDGSIE